MLDFWDQVRLPIPKCTHAILVKTYPFPVQSLPILWSKRTHRKKGGKKGKKKEDKKMFNYVPSKPC